MTLFFYYQRKKDALNIYYRVKLFLKEELNLSLNDKSCYFKNTKGIDFCGYKIFETHILLRNRFKKKLRKSIKVWQCLKKKEKFYKNKFLLCLNSYKGHASHANSYNYMQKINNIIKNI